MNLKGKVAVVTGGALRVGKAISLGLAKEGVKLGIHYHSSTENANGTLSEINKMGGEALLLQADFSQIAEIEKVVNECYAHFGQLDFLINNAAVYFRTPLEKTTEKQWDELLNINLKAPFFCAKFAASLMKEGGKIISISDVAGISPWPGFLPYCASKAGLISITKGLAKALAPRIQVNAIASGTVLLSEDATEEFADEIKNLTLLKRIGSPQDIVNTVIFLLKNDFMTGEVIAVDGGRLLV